jgi:hypothetical protein
MLCTVGEVGVDYSDHNVEMPYFIVVGLSLLFY